MQGLFITGNNTEVGKTFIASKIIQQLEANFKVSVRKLVETNCEIIAGRLIPKDAIKLQQSCKNQENIDTICPYKFSKNASGELASEGDNITLDDLVAKCQSDNFLVVEGSGGFYSPLIKNTLNSDLAKALNLPVVIVIEDKLGCISEALLTIKAVKSEGLKIDRVVLNQRFINNLDNITQLKKYCDETVVQFIGSDFAKL